MSACARVRHARRRLGATVALSAVMWGAAVGGVVLGLLVVAGRLALIPHGLPSYGIILACAGGGVIVAGLLWRGRSVVSLGQTALWLEEHAPELEYALVTASDPRIPGPSPLLEAVVERVDTSGIVRRAVARNLVRAGLALGTAAGLLGVMSAAGWLRDPDGRRETSDRGTGGHPLGNRLLQISARVIPPAYSREGARTLTDPSSLAGLPGGEIALVGSGDSKGILGVMGTDTLRAMPEQGHWTVGLTMPLRGTAVRLRDRSYSRILVLAPRTDSIPAVTLSAPRRDTTYRQASGHVLLEASAHDDIGLAHGYFELLITAGSGEIFKSRSAVSGRTSLGDQREARLHASLNLAALRLSPGAVLSIRAIAFDGNTVSGPGKGISETRTLRMARADEYDSVAIVPAEPLPIDTTLISQRMLIIRTETLVVQKPRLQRQAFESRSTQLSLTQENIRMRVEAIVQNLESDDAGGVFVTPVSTLLRQASAQMWDARTSLGVAEPEEALAPMRRALKLLQKAREAHRIYLRGLVKQDVVDLERVRLQGKDSAAAARRDPRLPLERPREVLARRLAGAIRLKGTLAEAAMDSLSLLQVDALTVAPEVAGSLAEAVEQLRRGQDASRALSRARRALDGHVAAHGILAPWSTGSDEPQ